MYSSRENGLDTHRYNTFVKSYLPQYRVYLQYKNGWEIHFHLVIGVERLKPMNSYNPLQSWIMLPQLQSQQHHSVVEPNECGTWCGCCKAEIYCSTLYGNCQQRLQTFKVFGSSIQTKSQTDFQNISKILLVQLKRPSKYVC